MKVSNLPESRFSFQLECVQTTSEVEERQKMDQSSNVTWIACTIDSTYLCCHFCCHLPINLLAGLTQSTLKNAR